MTKENVFAKGGSFLYVPWQFYIQVILNKSPLINYKTTCKFLLTCAKSISGFYVNISMKP